MLSYLRKTANKGGFASSLVYFGYLLYERLNHFVFWILHFRPVQKNKIVFTAMHGERYGDNPFYISEVLRKNKDLDIVWLLKPEADDEVPEGVTRVDYNNFFETAKALSTAAVWVDSNMKRSGFIKKKNQLYVQTWHGSYGFKKVGLDLGKALTKIDNRTIRYNARYMDYLLSNSDLTSEIYTRALAFQGTILKNGSPRNDMLREDPQPYREKVLKAFHSEADHILLYAPTYRRDFMTDSMGIDFPRLQSFLEEHYGGKWLLLIRLHYKNLAAAAGFIPYSDTIQNASDYGVMQELLAASDILISDYSSCMFDFITTGKPCYVFASDLEEYEEDTGSYWKMSELPFPLARDNDELIRNIREFDPEQYRKDLDGLFERVGLSETGRASEAAAEAILQWMEQHQ